MEEPLAFTPARASAALVRESAGIKSALSHSETETCRVGDLGKTSQASRTLAHYQISTSIGAGGMGEVYRATDSKLEREVALRVLPPDIAADPDRLARFRREARAVAALTVIPTSL